MARASGVRVLAAACVAVGLLGGARAQDVDRGEGGQCAAQTGTPTYYSIKEIQTDISTSEGVLCHGSAKAGQYVQTEGVVTAVGSHKDSYNSDYFWIQDGNDLGSGLELYYEDHLENIARGDKIKVSGVIREFPKGLTILYVCSFTTLSQNNALPEPVEVTSATFSGTCTSEMEGYEGMLVKISSPKVIDCATGTVNAGECSAGILPTDTPSWDKYKQMWVTTDDGATFVEFDNHIYTIFNEWVTTPGTTFTSLTGIVSFYHDEDDDFWRWDIIPRDANDVEGGTRINESSFRQGTIDQLQQLEYRYGNSDASVPTSKAGADVTVKSGEKGTANWEHGTCPNSTMQAWSYDQKSMDDAMTHSMCACYPASNMVDLLTFAGYYTIITGRVSSIDEPKGPFYLENEDCSNKRGLYVYRNSPQPLAVGDIVKVKARPYYYYGSEQLSDPTSIEVISKDSAPCGPVSVANLAAFHIPADISDDTGHGSKLKVDVPTPGAVENAKTVGFCKDCAVEECAELYEGLFIKVDKVKVVGFTKDWYYRYGGLDQASSTSESWKETVYNRDGTPVEVYPRGPYQNHACSGVTGGCQMIVEDRYGYQMLVDNKNKGVQDFFRGDVAASDYTEDGQKIAVGDTFTSITCLVDQHRGEYPLGRGGHYDCNPEPGQMLGWNEPWPSDDDEMDIGVIIGIVVGAVVGAGAIAFVMYKVMVKKTVDSKLREVQVTANPAQP